MQMIGLGKPEMLKIAAMDGMRCAEAWAASQRRREHKAVVTRKNGGQS